MEALSRTILNNGIAVISERMPHVRSVSVGIWVKAGSRYESAQENGIAHFIEHLLFKGTQNRSAEAIAREIDSIGGNLDAFTSKELVCFNGKMLDEHLSVGFDILADLVLNPLFREEDIEKERGVVLEELKAEFDNPELMVHDIFSEHFWKGNPLGRPILGSNHTVKRLNQAMIRQYFHNHYTPANFVISAAGNVDHGRLVKLVEERFGHLPPGKQSLPQPANEPSALIQMRSKKSLEQTHVCLGVPFIEMTHPMRYAGYVLNTLLGGSVSSRLFQNVREKRGLAYSVLSEQYLYQDAGCLSVYAGTSTEAVPELIRLTLAEFRDLKERPVPPDELRRAKDNLKGSLMLSLESTGSRMSHIARQHIYYNRFATMDELLEQTEAVTAQQIRELANQYLVADKIALTLLGPLNGLRISREDLVC
ncbi:MAG: insulinase family protein [Bryobacteraceae bacterium]|nr:insulinase family protein [Bryobacteraceae bacterium]MDW8379752.1 pitrilysin family protein [Bryobacterales bacterium]